MGLNLQNSMEGQEISMKFKKAIWHITFGVLMKNTNLGAQMTFHAKNDVTFDLFVPDRLSTRKKCDMKNLPIVSVTFIINSYSIYDKRYIIWKEIFRWFQKYKVHSNPTILDQITTICHYKWSKWPFLVEKLKKMAMWQI